MKCHVLTGIAFLCLSVCIYGQDANHRLSNLDSVAVNKSLLPRTDSSINLGSLTKQWKILYLGQSIYLDGTIFMHNGTRLGGSPNNTFLGREAGLNEMGSGANVGIGYRSMMNNTTGTNNTAIGLEALHSNSSGGANVAVGFAALHFNLVGEGNVAVGINTLYSNTGYNNTATGFEAMSLNTTGAYNVASGSHALQFNTTGYSNVAIGADALSKGSIKNNIVAIGDSALMNNGFSASSSTQGTNNTAVGSKAGMKLTKGNNSTYIGWQSGYNSTTGNANTAVGASSLFSNTTGSDNIAMGVDALYSNTKGAYNTVIGKGAGYANTTGNANVSLGVRSLFSNISGIRNTAIGDSAGFTSKGSYNTFLGAFADVTGSGLTNATAIGYNAKVSTDNTIVLGDATTPTNVAIGATTAGDYKLKIVHRNFGFDIANSVSSNNWEQYVTDGSGTTDGGASYTPGDLLLYYNFGANPVGAFDHTSGAYKTTSDERMKTNIKPMTSILDKINQLEPVTYNFKNSNNPIVSMGFIAQKVEKIFPSLVSHYTDTARGTDVNLMDYTGFGVIAIKGIQELQKQMHDKDSSISYQQKQIDELKNNYDAKIDAMQKQIDELKAMIVSGQSTVSKQQLTSISSASLQQNIPNPFTNSTSIAYSIPATYSSAKIIITDKNGTVLKQINLSGNKGNIQVDASTLSSGAYQYTLYVDGKVIDTKQMVKVR